MFTATVTTLAAVAALNGQVVSANSTVAATAPSDRTAAITISAPAKPAARIPGTFAVDPQGYALEGVEALYVVHTGDA